jgi:hypothetical protein
MNPEYSRDRDINVYSARSSDPAASLVVGVRDGLVTLSMDMHWSCRPQDVDKLAAALAEAQRLAAQWTERDERIARLMDKRQENANLWWPQIEAVLRQHQNALLTDDEVDSIRVEIDAAREAVVWEVRRLNLPGARPEEIPIFIVTIDKERGSTHVEPNWESVASLRWVE